MKGVKGVKGLTLKKHIFKQNFIFLFFYFFIFLFQNLFFWRSNPSHPSQGNLKKGKRERFSRSFEKLNRKKYFYKILLQLRKNLSLFPFF